MIQEFSAWLGDTDLSRRFADASWFVPAVQTLHIFGIAAVVTLLGMLNVRVLKLTSAGPSAHALAKSYVPWVWRAVVLLLITGILLTIAEPSRELMNYAFRVKMGLVLILLALTFVLSAGLRASPQFWSVSSARRFTGRAIAATSLILCIGIVAAGRLIAYI